MKKYVCILCTLILFNLNCICCPVLAENTYIDMEEMIAYPYANMSYEELTNLVNKIGNNLIKSNKIENQASFEVDMSEDIINAHVNVYDNVVVYKGLIDLCKSEDEIAFIIGHELGHATQTHIVKGARAEKVGNAVVDLTKFAAQYGLAIAASLDKIPYSLALEAEQRIPAYTSTANQAAQLKYSRTHEFDADLLGISYMQKAGYNPLASISIMIKIGEIYPDFWADHPSTERRVNTMKKYIKKNFPQYLNNSAI